MGVGLFLKYLFILLIVTTAGNIIGRLIAQKAFRQSFGAAILFLILAILLLSAGIYFAWRIESVIGYFAAGGLVSSGLLSFSRYAKRHDQSKD